MFAAGVLVLRTLIVDDSFTTLKVLSARMAAFADVHLEGLAGSGAEALVMTERFRPDLVLLDVSLGDMSGFEVARTLKARADAPFVAIVTVHDLPEYQQAAEAAGADAFVSKHELAAELPEVIVRARAWAEVHRPHPGGES